MSRLLFIYEQDMPTVSITRISLQNLSANWDFQPVFMYLRDVKPADIEKSDVVFFMRPNNVLSAKIAERARRAGCFVISFTDDDLLNLPQNLPTIPWRKRGLLRTLRSSDAIASSSQYILDKYRPLTAGKRTALFDTIVEEREIEAAEQAEHPSDRSVTQIVYAAGGGHVKLFDRFIRPILPALIEKYKDRIAFTFVGVRPELAEYEDQIPIHYAKVMPLEEYRKYMLESQFDIGLAPLYDDEFSKCKYFNKFMEYTLQGVVGIYSRVEPYTYVVKHGVNGFLADNTEESWLACFETAIENAALCKRCRENALQLLKENFTEEKIGRRIFSQLPEMLGHTRPGRKCGSFFFAEALYYLLRPFDWLYLSWFYLKKTGISGFVAKVKAHFRDRGAYSRKQRK